MDGNDDPWITKLQVLFMSCDPRGAGLLGHDQLRDLCNQLQLNFPQSQYLIEKLVGQDPFVKVDFDEFKEVFVKLLTVDTGAIDKRQNVLIVREHLMSIWTKLGLPENGHLTIGDLKMVCSEIGMVDVGEEAVKQLFATLGRDGDGKVTFEDLLSGMPCQQEPLICRKGNVDSQGEKSFSISTNFLVSLFDSNKDGLVNTESVIRLWESIGITDGESILKNLDLIGPEINVQNLSDLMEEELVSLSSPSKRGGSNLAQVAFVTFRNEFNQLKVHLDQMSEERVKLKQSVTEANMRADLLAQEVDDHHRQLERATQERIMLMEKKHRERLSALEQELLNERELACHRYSILCLKYEKEQSTWQECDHRAMETIKRLEQERNKISSDLRFWIEKCCHLETKNFELLKKFDESLSMTERLETKSEQHLDLERELETTRNQTKKLQDLNDELIVELEKIRKEVKGPLQPGAVPDPRKMDVSILRKGQKKRRSTTNSFNDNEERIQNVVVNDKRRNLYDFSSSSGFSCCKEGLEDGTIAAESLTEPLDRPDSKCCKIATCTKFIEYLLKDFNDDSLLEVKHLLTTELLDTRDTSRIVVILLQHLKRIRTKSSPRKEFHIKSNASEKLIASLYLESTRQLKLIQELEMSLMKAEKENASLNCECKYLNKVIKSQWRHDFKQ